MKTSVYDNDVFFENYQKLRSNPNSLNEVVEKPTMLSLLPDLQGKKLLDLGCGMGEHLQLYLAHGAQFVVGVDLSATMLAQAQADLTKLSKKSPHFSLYQLALEELEQLDETGFDVITGSFVFHYVENLPALLNKIYTKLNSGGVLVFSQEHPITTCHKTGERWEKGVPIEQRAYRLRHYRDEGERKRNWFQQPFITYHRTIATIMNHLIATGFRIVRVEEPMLEKQPEWHAEFKDVQHRPPLLFIKAEKM